MSKERLEEIRKDYQKIINLDYEDKFNDSMVLKRLFFENHGKWLIEQTKRTQELEEKFEERENELIRILTNRYKYITQLENTEIILSGKIKRYREALEFYAMSGQAIGETKHGEVARKELESEE